MTSQVELVDSRVDWLTATMMLQHSPSDDTIERAIALHNKLLYSESSKGNDIRKFSFSGFDGYSCGGVSAGSSPGGMIFRLSSDAARDHWREVYDASTNVSRIDVAATVKLQGGWRDLSHQHLLEARDFQRDHSPRLKVRRIDGGKHGSTLTIGSRSSDAYGRIYDKHAESKQDAFIDCWRYEVEFKRDLANQTAALLAAEPDAHLIHAGVASEWFRSRGCAPGWVSIDRRRMTLHVQPTDEDKRLRWLRVGVRGSVQRLLAAGRRADVLKALGLSEASDI